jgi:hypothetical protein
MVKLLIASITGRELDLINYELAQLVISYDIPLKVNVARHARQDAG